MNDLLSRDDFRRAVFKRDKHACVVCGVLAQDAHHILERRLWPDGGYYLDNGASVCGQHHIEAEQTILTPDTLREQAGITRILLPPDLYEDQEYDKWGNPLLPNGQRARGPLFYDESVQRVLAPVLYQFTKYVKHPRTWHLPWSPGMNDDDRKMPTATYLYENPVVVTEKMDGEQTTMYNDHVHARSIDSKGHPSRDWVKNLWGQIAHDIPEDMRVCGENLYAKHSIGYMDLPTYFLVHSIWERDTCLSWQETEEWCELLGLQTVPVLYKGLMIPVDDLNALMPEGSEGYVIRMAHAIPMSHYSKSVGKFVRKGHVQTHGHWMRSQIERNGLSG